MVEEQRGRLVARRNKKKMEGERVKEEVTDRLELGMKGLEMIHNMRVSSDVARRAGARMWANDYGKKIE